jgi:hypothetical protein
MALTQETKPKMKKRVPIIDIEMNVSFFVSEPAWTTAVIDFDIAFELLIDCLAV